MSLQQWQLRWQVSALMQSNKPNLPGLNWLKSSFEVISALSVNLTRILALTICTLAKLYFEVLRELFITLVQPSLALFPGHVGWGKSTSLMKGAKQYQAQKILYSVTSAQTHTFTPIAIETSGVFGPLTLQVLVIGSDKLPVMKKPYS